LTKKPLKKKIYRPTARRRNFLQKFLRFFEILGAIFGETSSRIFGGFGGDFGRVFTLLDT
jgi:hypothetical protein